jgi:hypothetical protein
MSHCTGGSAFAGRISLNAAAMLLISIPGKSAAKREQSMLISAGLGFSLTTDEVSATCTRFNDIWSSKGRKKRIVRSIRETPKGQ